MHQKLRQCLVNCLSHDHSVEHCIWSKLLELYTISYKRIYQNYELKYLGELLLPFIITDMGIPTFPMMLPQTTAWTINVHTCPEKWASEHVIVVLDVVVGHLPQLMEVILYDIESHCASTEVQLKLMCLDWASVSCTSVGGGKGAIFDRNLKLTNL